MRLFPRLLAALVVTLAMPGIAAAAPPTDAGAPAPGTTPTGFDAIRRIDANQVNMWVTNFGSYAFDPNTGNAGFIYPRGTNKTAIYAAGLWLGGLQAAQT